MPTSPPVLITGANGGLGRKASQALAGRGRDLILHGRREAVIDELCHELTRRYSIRTTPMVADLASLEQVNGIADRLKGTPLHGIIANAGLTTIKDLRSHDGYELTFAVNVLAHQVLLTRLSGQLEPGGRIVVVSSGVHEPTNKLARRCGVPIPNWRGVKELASPPTGARLPWDEGPRRYSTSKLANVFQARELQKRLREQELEVDVFALDPGLMVDTGLAREIPQPLRWILACFGRALTPFVDNMRLSSQSAEHIASLSEDPSWDRQGFAYIDGDRAKDPSPDAQREELSSAFWSDVHALLGLSPELGTA